jgi:hypothetical protein
MVRRLGVAAMLMIGVSGVSRGQTAPAPAGGASARPGAEEAGTFRPFTVDHLHRTDSEADVSFLLRGPAGKDGFIRSQKGHLVTPDGERFRIWGVNLTSWTQGSTNIPPKDQAALWAAEMARYGINCVRFHFLDMPNRRTGGRRSPIGLIDGSREDTQHFDPEQLDRLDFFIAELKKRGIYSNLNLNVGRTYKPGDEVPDSSMFGAAGKGFTFIGPRLLELQKDYAKQLLTHVNPYTRSSYAQEPAVAIVELVNENSLFEFWDRNWLRGERGGRGSPNPQLDLTPAYEKLLTQMYNDWLKEHRSAEELAVIRKEAGVKEGEMVPRLRKGDVRGAPEAQFLAEAAFYESVERNFFEGMKKYLRETLGVRSLIVGTADHTYFIPNLPLLRSTSAMDMVDGHVYWQHPSIWGERNTPMVNDPLDSIIVKLARSPMAGRPFTVSEVNHPNPNEYACEMIPILAAYAGFQDWDGVCFYTFELKTGADFQPFVTDNFDITQDPVKMMQMETGALMFLRGDVQPAKRTVSRTYTREQALETMQMPEAARPYFTPGFPLSLPLRHGSRIASLDGPPTAAFAPDPVNAGSKEYSINSDTGELAWHVSQEKGGVVTIDTERTQGLVGFVKGNSTFVGGRGRVGLATTGHLAADVENAFCAIMLSSLDIRPMRVSNTMLMTTGSRIENTGTKWNDRHTLWETWGTAPTLIDPVRGYVTLKDLDGAVAVELVPLDGAAKPIGRPIQGKRNEDGWELQIGTVPTTFYVVHVTR